MNLFDIFAETFRSLAANKARSILTILGIVVGIGSVIALISVGQGTKSDIQGQITDAGTNTITITNLSSGNGLTDGDLSALRELPDVSAVVGTRQDQAAITANGASVTSAVTGVDGNYTKVAKREVSSGTFISTYQNSIKAHAVVLSPTVVEALWGSETYNAVGQTVKIAGHNFIVTGITQSNSGGITAALSGDACYAPLSTVTSELTGKTSYSVLLSTTTMESQTAVTNLATNLLKSRHGLSQSDTADFSVISMSSLLDLTNTIMSMMTALLAAIASISLVVGGIGIMNMMLTSVTERIREIGLRKAIGATPTNITLQFLVEAVVLTAMGGLIGVLLGWIISLLVNTTNLLSAQVTGSAVLLAVGVCMLIGIIFGFYPARRAAKLDPIDALRYQ